MKFPLYQVDAFTSELFSGNPAAVCPLSCWPEDELLQRIAAENNLSETAFFVDRGHYYQLRWFTPQAEIDLCGHATLASAYIIMNYVDKKTREVVFGTHSGELRVTRNKNLYSLDFPIRPAELCPVPENLEEGLGLSPVEVLAARDYLVVLESEEQVRKLKPKMTALEQLDRMGIIVTAKGNTVDFVSRFFAPSVGIPEDPVTGSAHCTLTPYWAQKLNKKEFHAHQVSARGGELFLRLNAERVFIAGHVAPYLEGVIEIKDFKGREPECL